MPISSLQNRTKLGTAVGLAYQSPPPLYCKTPTWTSATVWPQATPLQHNAGHNNNAQSPPFWMSKMPKKVA